MHPREVLQGYRLGGHRATVELQKSEEPGIHIDFQVLRLVADIRVGESQAIVLTGTAGDGKTYLAYHIVDALGLDPATVNAVQSRGGYDQDGIYIDLDLSAGVLTDERVGRLYQALSTPARLTLVCANEGKLSELEDRFCKADWKIPQTAVRINLSHRALASRDAWQKILVGVLEAPFWEKVDLFPESAMARNRAWLQDPSVGESVRRYLLLPYLLGEPITVREVLSFLAYVLMGDLTLADADREQDSQKHRLPYLLFNTLFSEPGGYVHGGRAAPGERLLWWMFRFDPGATAHPEADLKLLTQLDQLELEPPEELADYWRSELVTRSGETSDTRYRQRVSTYMRFARRWYALFTAEGQDAYFPFRYYDQYVEALSMPPDELDDQIGMLIRGLNLLLSGGRVEDEFNLYPYHMAGLGVRHQSVIYSDTRVPHSRFQLASDLILGDSSQDVYLERHPRRLYLCYPVDTEGAEQIRLPISLQLYEVLKGIASPSGGFPATLWAKERHSVTRFVGALCQHIPETRVAQFRVVSDGGEEFSLVHDPKSKRVQVT